VILPGPARDVEDLIFAKTQIVAPAADMLAGRPALPPTGQSGGVEAQRAEQFREKIIRNRRARALLLLYWFIKWFPYPPPDARYAMKA